MRFSAKQFERMSKKAEKDAKSERLKVKKAIEQGTPARLVFCRSCAADRLRAPRSAQATTREHAFMHKTQFATRIKR